MPCRTPVGASDGRLLTGFLTAPNRLQGVSLTGGYYYVIGRPRVSRRHPAGGRLSIAHCAARVKAMEAGSAKPADEREETGWVL